MEPAHPMRRGRRGLRACAALLCLSLLQTAGLAAMPPNDPKPDEAAAAEAGWRPLFDGVSLDGWRANENPRSFVVRDGRIVVHGPRAHLFYVGPVAEHAFGDFELQLEVMTRPGANSGVYFHTAWQDEGWPARGYEVQVNNSASDPKRTGSLYGVRDVFEAPARDDAWFTLTVRVEGRRIRTYVDGRLLVDYTEEADPRRPPEFAQRLLGAGTFALQAHDPESEVHYRDIRVRVLR
ncbi:uncharacterized protein DUF1080 [Vulcaniibacterium tengchongense]|uniref:Uncharacterized protein DUF1080 n=2 Tax=Vulcaniibacterium tengchongense TaxID=1273429 RepID=A0A3N4VWY5_9GAMM|nr:uncharacterized protein DUF1080 [Vulcaniibacterium tengchongense]